MLQHTHTFPCKKLKEKPNWANWIKVNKSQLDIKINSRSILHVNTGLNAQTLRDIIGQLWSFIPRIFILSFYNSICDLQNTLLKYFTARTSCTFECCKSRMRSYWLRTRTKESPVLICSNRVALLTRSRPSIKDGPVSMNTKWPHRGRRHAPLRVCSHPLPFYATPWPGPASGLEERIIYDRDRRKNRRTNRR